MSATMSIPRGRPLKSPDQLLSEVVNFRLTPSEADQLYSSARRAGVSPNNYMRELLRRVLSEGFSVGKKSL